MSKIAGKELTVEYLGENGLSISIENQKVDIVVEWINKRRGYDESIKDILGDTYEYPFPDKNQCIRVFRELDNTDYLEVTLLYLLKQSGGISENAFDLPLWAGKSWIDRPRKWWQLT
ncbi:hypothetical protein G8759_25155 [Spirosoma aureum]|uniref:Uncharacterized protein n=1 Tax=Spirosoma aureum TaxID=2692134 RepID=A0A6G9ATT0_9BACT|nr:hypothetical protein [Spirosoma aureum]QIP15685.1 hypothetical protein G8759_25155 [Spirosoma aureum]